MGSRTNLQIVTRAAKRRAVSVAAFVAMLLGLAVVVALGWHEVGIVFALSGAVLLLGARELLAATLGEQAGAEYRELAMSVPVGVVRRDRQGRLTFVNREFLAIAGLPSDTAVGDISASLFHPDDRDPAVAAMERTRRTGLPYEHELRLIRPDGELRFVVVRGSVQPGESTGYLATVTDVTERRSAAAALSRSERLHRQTLNSLPGVLVGLYDLDLRCVLMEGEASDEQLNTAVCAGRTLAEFANRETAELLEPGMRAAILEGREGSYTYHSPRDGTYRSNHVGPLRTAEGEIEGVVIVSRDVTKERLVEEARRAADEQFRIAFEHAPIGIVSLEPDGRFRRVNQALCDMSGHTGDELLAMAPLAIVHPDDVAAVRECIDEIDARDTVAIEHRITHALGHSVWVDTRIALIRDEHGKPVQMLAQVQDIDDRRHYEQRLEHMADHDPLTGLLNRRGLERELEAQLARVRRYPGGGTLVLIDLDGFKDVNDTLGHAAGDELIVSLADLLRGRLRETDVIARMGGDEFAVILPLEAADGAAIVAQALLRTLRAHTSVTASIGLAAFEGDLTADEMFVRADRAMYSAKQTGKDSYAQYADIAVTAPAS